MGALSSIIDRLSKDLQQEYGLVIADEERSDNPGVFLQNSRVRIGFWQDWRGGLIEADIGTIENWGDLARRDSMHMIIRFKCGDMSELQNNRPNVEISEQVQVCLSTLRKHARDLLAGDAETFSQLYWFSSGYRCRYNEEASGVNSTAPAPKARRTSFATIAVAFFLGAALTGAAIFYWLVPLRVMTH